MRVSLMILVLVLVCFEGFAATYEKASDNQLKVITETTKEETLTVPQIQHEIDGITNDIARIEESYTKQRGEFEARKARYEAMLLKCAELEIAEPIIIDKIEEPIEEPLQPIEDING